MRILILHNVYAQRGGEDTVVRAERAALEERGHSVCLLTRDSEELRRQPLRGAAETLLTVGNPRAARRVADALRAFAPDVVHVHNLFPRWGLAALRTLQRQAVPVVQTLHNFRWLCAPATLLRDGLDCRLCARGNFASAVRYRCMRQSAVVSGAYALALAVNRLGGLAERSVARFVCVSNFVRDVYLQAGFAPDKLTVKGHFVADAPGGSGPRDGTVLYAGRLSPEKGVRVLLQAMSGLPDTTLKIAGEGPERTALGEQAKRLGVKALFLGRLSREALQRELQRSSVCVVPSIGSETFGLSVIEALACACPVITSDAGALPELVREGEDGFIFARGDHGTLAGRLRVLLQQPGLARELGAAGWARIRRDFLPAANVARLEVVYREAMELQRSSARRVGA